MEVWCIQARINRGISTVMDGPNLSEFEPSWSQDGYGLSGDQNNPDFSDGTTWDIYAGTIDQQSGDSWSTKVTSRQNQAPEDPPTGGGGCLGDAGEPPDMGTFVLGSVDGTCQWIDTTTCGA